jgi:Chloroplast import apparatus Tic20-like
MTQESAAVSSPPATALFGMWSQNDEIQGADRLKACIPYLLPLIDGDQFGRFIYSRIPVLGAVNDFTIGPLADIAHRVPFFSVIFFVALTLGTRFNTDMNRNIRFSAQQAALIDVALIFPELIGTCFEGETLPRSLVEPCNNFVWYAYMSAVLYSVYSNLRGKKPDQIPYLSTYSDLMVGPF